MKPQIPPHSDPLMKLLDEWQPQPEISATFDQQLHRRIAMAQSAPQASRWSGWLRAAMATMLLLIVGALLYFAPGRQARRNDAATQSAQLDPMVRDLQTLARDGDLLEHLDFLSATSNGQNSAPQERD